MLTVGSVGTRFVSIQRTWGVVGFLPCGRPLAKRFLVAEFPAYRACLSQASLDTLARQGGLLSPDEALQFSKAPGFDAAILVRRIDDEAKMVDKSTADYAAFKGMLKGLIAKAISMEGIADAH